MKIAGMIFKVLVLIAIVATFTWAGHCLVSGQMKKAEETAEVGSKPGLQSKVTGIEMTDKNATNELLKLKATTAWVTDDTMDMDEIDATFYSNGHEPLSIRSHKGVIEKQTNNANFSGAVKVRSPRPFLLETERLAWLEKDRLLTSKEKVKYTDDNSVINGKGIIIDVDTQDVTVLSTVHAVFN